jgi:hypothetical protein
MCEADFLLNHLAPDRLFREEKYEVLAPVNPRGNFSTPVGADTNLDVDEDIVAGTDKLSMQSLSEGSVSFSAIGDKDALLAHRGQSASEMRLPHRCDFVPGQQRVNVKAMVRQHLFLKLQADEL